MNKTKPHTVYLLTRGTGRNIMSLISAVSQSVQFFLFKYKTGGTIKLLNSSSYRKSEKKI
jgi:hypothetical protein